MVQEYTTRQGHEITGRRKWGIQAIIKSTRIFPPLYIAGGGRGIPDDNEVRRESSSVLKAALLGTSKLVKF